MKAFAITLSFLPLGLALITLIWQRWRLHEERRARKTFDRIMKASKP